MILTLIACAGHSPAPVDSPTAEEVTLVGGTVVGVGTASVHVAGGVVVAGTGGTSVDVAGRWLVPAFIDDHVHLAYLPEADELADGGIAAAVDLAAPLSFLAESHAPLRVLAAGPMVTAPGGYPLNAWGADGYGLGCDSVAACEAVVDQVVAAGAAVVKVPLAGDPELDDAELAAVVARAHAAGRKVAVHALSDDAAARAAAAGADLLAHTPVEALSAETVAAWSGKAVVSTLAAFGGSESAVANLAALRAAGATVLYGTDFGNTQSAGIQADELTLLQEAGLDGAAILAAGTSTPAAYWGWSDLGGLGEGKEASFLVLDADPTVDPSTLTRPVQVWLRGVRRR